MFIIIFLCTLLVSANTANAKELLSINENTSRCELLRALNGKHVPMDCRTKGVEPKKTAVLDDVLFANASYQLTINAKTVLTNVAQVMNETPQESYHVQGHANKTGAYQRNLTLSQQRAQTIKQFLIAQGVNEQRLIAEGFSYDKPLENTDPTDAINRRVEFANNRELTHE
ncbi:MAG: OmpA family protein [Methylococcaceae bacterium]